MATGVAVRPTETLAIEQNGINVISGAERKGRPRDLFWPWCAANIAVLGISYGSFLLGFGVSFWQATAAGLIGTILSFLLVGFVSLAGKRGSAPTMVLTRAAYGVQGGKLPAVLSYILLVGWEIVLVSLATLATATVFTRLGWGGGDATKIIAFLVVAGVVVFSGIFGFNLIMRLQAFLTVALAVLTVGYVLLTVGHINWGAVTSVPAGSPQAVLGALIFAATGFGLGWVNSGADYSRYLPRSASSAGVVGWTTFGAAIAPVVLIVYGLLLAASDQKLNAAIGGLIGGAVLDIYSSGLALLTIGLKVPRWMAAGIDGVIMILGTIYVVWIASNFIGPFQGFLITLGVPISAWCGVFLADLLLRKRDYAEADLYNPRGRYGVVNWVAVSTTVVATFLGWGLVTNTFASWLSWQGYLLNPLGLGPKDNGPWTFANVGVLVALVVAFAAYYLLGRSKVAKQEAA